MKSFHHGGTEDAEEGRDKREFKGRAILNY